MQVATFLTQIRVAIRKLRNVIEIKNLGGHKIFLGDGSPCVTIETLIPMLETVIEVAPHCPDEAQTVGQLVCNGLAGLTDELATIYDILATITNAFGDWYPSAKETDRMLRASWETQGARIPQCVGKWASEGGTKYWVRLLHGANGWCYESTDCSGDVCCGLATAGAAKAVLQSKIDRGMFVSNRAFLPMTKVNPIL